MAFVRNVLLPKQSYDAADNVGANDILTHRFAVEPRCKVDTSFCLKLRNRGEFVHYNGVGPDAGKTLHASFLTKANNRLRLAYFAPDGFSSNAEILNVMSQAVKDALRGVVTAVYWYIKDDDLQSTDKDVLFGLAAQVVGDWPALNITVSTPAGFTLWEVSQ